MACEVVFTNKEMVNMLLIYEDCHQNTARTEQLYAVSFPDWEHPTLPTFTNEVQKVWDWWIESKSITNETAEVTVLINVAINPHASSCKMERHIKRAKQVCCAFT